MIKFIYGRSHASKSKYIMNAIAKDAELGKRSFLIVPEQFAVQSEHIALRSLPASAQLTLEVLNFSRLYNRVCREYGGLEYNYITSPLRYCLMWEALRECMPFLQTYSQISTSDSSVCDMMLSAIGEFKAAGITPSELERAADKLDAELPLTQKMIDVSTVYSVFDSLVSQSFSDAADDISKLHLTLKEHDFFEGTNVYIDSFTSFTAAEYRVIEDIFASADNVTLTLPLSYPRQNDIYTESISDAEKRLFRCANKYGEPEEICLEDNEAQSTAIKYLADNLWNAQKPTEAPADRSAIYLNVCPSPYAEADAAARAVLSWLRDGYRCRDIVVIARDAEHYRGIIEPAFEKAGIPFYFSEKTDLSKTPIVKFILSAIKIKLYNWRTEDVISHVKTGLYDFEARSVDLFEQYVTTWQIRGSRFASGEFNMNPDGYAERINDRGRTILDEANSLREKLVGLLTPFFDALDSAEGLGQKCRAVYDFLVSCDIENRLSSLSEKEGSLGNTRAADEYSRLFALTCDSLGELVEAFEENADSNDITISEFYTLLSMLFSKTDMGTIPTSIDEVVIGSASMLRADTPRCAILLGLCEGVFPASVSDRGILTLAEKSLLADVGIELSSKGEFASSDELMYVKRAIELPTERLYMSTYTADSAGSKAMPSLPFAKAAKLFEDRVKNYDNRDLLELTPSLEGALAYLSKEPATESEIALYSYADKAGRLPSTHARPISDTECNVNEDSVNTVFGKDLYLSQSKIDKFLGCHFNYYCKYALALREEHISRFKANDIGTFIHYILEKLLCNLVGEDGINTDISPERFEEMARSVVNSYISKITPAGVPTTARLSYLFKKLYNLSLVLITNIIEEFRSSSFRPEFFELSTNGKEENPSSWELILKDGRKVIFSGIIDRVDVFRKDSGEIYLRVIDYKTGSKEFSLDDVKEGFNIQMLLYLFTLINNKNEKFKQKLGGDSAVPAGVIYLSSNIPMVDLSSYEEASEVMEKAGDELRRSGLLINDEEILTAMNRELSPKFLAGIKKKKTTGELSGKALTDPEAFKALEKDIEKVIFDISTEMLSGNANANPTADKKNSPCVYCAMKPVCRRKLK